MKLDFIKLTTQREFLIKLGTWEKAKIRCKKVPLSKKTDIYFRLRRLIDKQEMGSLFKILFATKKKNNFKLGF
jgi:cyclopropane-fatty-acyl-phospholipid synthase